MSKEDDFAVIHDIVGASISKVVLDEEVFATPAYEFGPEFETNILAFMLRDQAFNLQTEGLIKPEYFEDEVRRAVARVALEYFNTYKVTPNKLVLPLVLKEAFAKKIIKPELKEAFIEEIRNAYKITLDSGDYVVDQVARFARTQELTSAVLRAAEKIDKGDLDAVEPIIQKALLVNANDDGNEYDFFAEAENRFKYRRAVLAGEIRPDGITTGHAKFDDRLYHKGWGRKELTVLMGPAKAGKSMALIQFGLNALKAGHNVLYVSLEVSTKIIADRMDANVGSIEINDLPIKMKRAHEQVEIVESHCGVMKIHDFPSGTFSPNSLRRLLNRYKAKGVTFDAVIVDYADLMAPNTFSKEPRENSRMIYIDLRGIAGEFNVALLSATQTNRAGFSADLAKMEHVSDDINKVRTVDLLISINHNEADAPNETRLYLAASRNQAAATITIKTNHKMAKFMESITKIE